MHSGGATMGEWENAKVAVPDGAYPLFLTLTTQTNFHCREREECTVERPYVFVSKKTFLDDIQFRGVISDFHPTKKLIEAYPDGVDEQEDGTSGLLVVWDEEEDYGQNFYLVHKVKEGLGEDRETAEASPWTLSFLVLCIGCEAGGGGGGAGGGARRYIVGMASITAGYDAQGRFCALGGVEEQVGGRWAQWTGKKGTASKRDVYWLSELIRRGKKKLVREEGHAHSAVCC